MDIPQYAKTDDQRVLDIVDENNRLWREWRDRACAFALAHGADKGAFYSSSFLGTRIVTAIAADEKPTSGQWKRGRGGRGWAPYQNNPLHEEFASLSYSQVPVPGFPADVRGPMLPDGTYIIGSPTPFRVDGTAYVGFNFQPEPHHAELPAEETAIWTEILASEFHKAAETYRAETE